MRQDICPGCGSPNRCEVARSGGSGVQCWCMAITMPAELVHPVAGQACFCSDCAAAGKVAGPAHNEKAPG